MIKAYSLKAFELAINQGLRLDKEMPEKLKTLDGKIVEMIIEPLAVTFFMHFSGDTLKLLDKAPAKPDTTIHASPLGLIRLSILPASKARSLFNDKIKIKGDIELGQQIKVLFDNIDIDWEGHLAQFTGDVIAHQLAHTAKKGLEFGQHLQQSMRHNLTEYLQEEARTLVGREELNDFFEDIDTLRLDFDRLEAKFQQVTGKK
jgi:ubiquinone biosynthesis accessory factor UbiJ